MVSDNRGYFVYSYSTALLNETCYTPCKAAKLIDSFSNVYRFKRSLRILLNDQTKRDLAILDYVIIPDITPILNQCNIIEPIKSRFGNVFINNRRYYCFTRVVTLKSGFHAACIFWTRSISIKLWARRSVSNPGNVVLISMI